MLERARSGDQEPAIDSFFIEKSRPVGGALYAVEKPEDVMLGAHNIHSLKTPVDFNTMQNAGSFSARSSMDFA